MTYGARLFQIILAFQLLLANPVSLEYSIIPKIDCNDLNGNGQPDFIAVNNSSSPRSLYHIELKGPEVDILWEYSIPNNINGYFADMILGDYDNDGVLELIVVAYQDGIREIFYVFPVDKIGFNVGSPQILDIGNSSLSISQPQKLYSMSVDSEGYIPFILTQAGPSRHIIICKYIDGKINSVGSYGNNFLRNSMGPLELSIGNFNGDGIEDIFILSNGQNPEGYFIFSDGLEEKVDLDNYPRLNLLFNRGVDLNFDGIDDLLMVDRGGSIMSNIWGQESILLSERKIQNIEISLDNGLIHLISLIQGGKIGHYIIDPLSRGILTSKYNSPEFEETEFLRTHSLIIGDYVLLVHDGANPELWTFPLSMEPLTEISQIVNSQRIYSQIPDYFITKEEIFSHSIEGFSENSFLNFTVEDFPNGMEANLHKMSIEWIPHQSQLGFHEFSYELDFRKKDGLDMGIVDGKKIITQQESLISNNYTHLIYVNDPVKFRNTNKHFIITNTKQFEWTFSIDDYNVDALLTVQKIGGEKEALFQLLQFENIVPHINKSIQVETLDPLRLEIITEDISLQKMKLEKSGETSIVKENIEEFADTLIEEIKIDTAIFKDEIVLDAILDSSIQEISYIEIAPHKAKFSWSPNTKPNDYNFTLTVSDGYSNDTLDIILTVHPEIDLSINKTEFVATVNKLFSTKVEFKQNPQSDSFFYDLQSAPENMRITDHGVINWIPLPTQVDNYFFIVDVTDGKTSSEMQYNIYVNAIPVISARPSEQVIINRGDSLSFSLESFDMNTDAQLTWSLLLGPTDMILNSEGVLKWTGNQLDNHPYKIQLSDGIDSVQWVGTIYVNVAPTFISTPITFISEHEPYKYQLEAQDDNNISHMDIGAKNKIQFELLNSPLGMKIDNQNILRWEPAENISGKFPISIIATDGINEIPQNFQLLVNALPIITSLDSISIKIGDTLNFNIEANDANLGDSLSYLITNMLPGMGLDQASGLMHWIPSKPDIGQHYFNLQVTDGNQKSITKQNLQIFVFEPPIFTGDLLAEAFVGLEYKAFLIGIDMFGRKLRDEKTISIESATIKDYTLSEYGRYLQWMPGEMDLGKQEIHIRITDEYGFTEIYTHTISVFNNPCFQCDRIPEESLPDTTSN